MEKEDTPFKILDEIYYNICNNQKTKITLVSQNIFQNKDLAQELFRHQDDQIDIYTKNYDLFDVLVIYYNDLIYYDDYTDDKDITHVDYFQALKVLFKRKKEIKLNNCKIDINNKFTWNYNLDDEEEEDEDDDEENYYLMFTYNKKNKEIKFFSSIKDDYEEYKKVLIYINNNLDYIMNEFYLQYL